MEGRLSRSSTNTAVDYLEHFSCKIPIFLAARERSYNMIGLNELPTELIDNVCKHLRNLHLNQNILCFGGSAKTELASLSLTSKRLHDVVQPHLYSTIRISDYKRHLIPLTRSIFKNNSLTELVHEVEITASIDDYTSDIYDKFVKQRLPHILEQSTDGLDFPHHHPLFFSYHLLKSLQPLKVINFVTTDATDFWNCLLKIRSEDLACTSFLPNLEEINTRHGEKSTQEFKGFYLGQIVNLLQNANIQRCTLQSCLGTGIETGNWRFTTLRELRIMRSALSVTDLEQIVHWCPYLQLFRYQLRPVVSYDYRSIREGNAKELAQPSAIASILVPLRRTLRTLFLDSTLATILDLKDISGIESLTMFDRLEHLAIDEGHMANWVRFADSKREREMHADMQMNVNIDMEAEDEIALKKKADEIERIGPFRSKLPKSLKSLLILEASALLQFELSRLVDTAHLALPQLRRLTIVGFGRLGFAAMFEDTAIDYHEFRSSECDILDKDFERLVVAC